MKSKFHPVALVVIVLLLTQVFSCKKEDPTVSGSTTTTTGGTVPPPPVSKIDPSNANGVTSALVIDNSTKFKGNIPAPQKPAGDSIAIFGVQNSVEVSAGGEVILPFNYVIASSQSYTVSQYYVHVTGADSTFKVTKNLTGIGYSGTMSQRIRIPNRINFGSFCLTVGVTYVRADGSIYQPPTFTVCINITSPKTCGQTVSGSEGLTFTNLTLGTKAGNATVNYNTYSVPDRIDVYYNGNWVAGTGTNPGAIPPQKNCVDVVPNDGFIGATGALTFAYDPAVSKDVTVVVSGCLGNSTAWDYSIACP